LSQTQNQLLLSKEQEILQLTSNSNKDLNKMRNMVKNKTDEIEKLKRYLEEIEDELIKMK